MKKRIIKTFALFLVLVMAFSSIGIVAPISSIAVSDNTSSGAESISGKNLFLDGSFENCDVAATSSEIKQQKQDTDFENWYRTGYGGATYFGSTEDHSDGSKSLKLSVQSLYNNTYAYYKNIKVEQNTNYSISFKYKVTELDGDFRALITNAYAEDTADSYRAFFTNESATWNYNTDGSNNSSKLTTATTDGWVTASCAFNSGENTVLRLYFRLRNSSGNGPAGNSTVFVDDIVLNSHGLALNGGFEDYGKVDQNYTAYPNYTETDAWWRCSNCNAGNTVIGSNEQAHSGVRSFKLHNTATRTGHYLNFNVEQNANYRVTFWYKVTTAGQFDGAIGTTDMTKLDNTTGRIIYFGVSNNHITNSVTSDWVKVQKTFNSGDNTLARIMFWMAANGVAYLDDLCIEKIPDPMVVEGNIFDNGSFENAGSLNDNGESATDDTENWYRKNTTDFAKGQTDVNSTEESYTGLKSLKISANPANSNYKYFYFKNFAVDANSDYEITFYYNMTAANGQFRAEVGTTNDYETNGNHLAPMAGDGNTLVCSSVTDGWVKITRKFNSSNNTMLRLILGLYQPSTTLETTVYVDDISVVKVDHIPVIDGAVAPTCTETGLTQGSHCEFCGNVIVAQTVVPATGHTYGTPTYSWSGDQCTATAVCSECDDQTTGHSVTSTITGTYEKDIDANCTTAETGHYTATFTDAPFTGTSSTEANSVTNGQPKGHTQATKIENLVAPAFNSDTKTYTDGSYDEVVYCSVCHEEISRTQKTLSVDDYAEVKDLSSLLKVYTQTNPDTNSIRIITLLDNDIDVYGQVGFKISIDGSDTYERSVNTVYTSLINGGNTLLASEVNENAKYFVILTMYFGDEKPTNITAQPYVEFWADKDGKFDVTLGEIKSINPSQLLG